LTPSSVTITPPPGWTSVRRTNTGGGVTNALEVFYKVATNSEPAGYVWTFSAAASAVGGIQAYSGVDITNPIDAEDGSATASASIHVLPSINTTVANTMLVAHYTLSSSGTWSTTPPPAPAMTESFDVLFPPAGATGQSLQGTRITRAATGATPAYRSTASGGGGNADFGVTHVLALRPQPSNQLDLPKPPGTVANDVMIAAIGFQPRTLTITPPAGWQLIQRMDNAAGTGNSLAVYRLTAGVSEPAVYEWTFSGALTAAAGGIQSFSGVDTGNPVDAAAGQTTPSNTTHTTPGITTTIASTMLVTSHTYASSQAWTAAAGMTEAYDRFNLAAPGAGGQSTTGAFVAQPPAGPVAGKSAVAAGSADTGNAHIVALRPAPVNVVPGRFNAYDAPVAGIGPGVIKTKIAGSAMSLAIVALNAAGNAIEAGFSDNVQVDVVDASTGGAVDGNNCNPAWPVIATAPASWTVMLNSGSAVLGAVSVPNAYPNARIRIIYPVGAAYPGTAAGCSMDNFANRPASLTVIASDADWATPGAAPGRTLDNTNPAASPVHKAGQPFRVTVTPQPASVTQYAGVPTVKTASCLTLAGMTGCANGVLGLSAGDWSGNGTRINDNATYGEAGALTLELEDQNFANVDLADSTALERTIPQTGGGGPVGRFVPDHFTVAPHPMGPAPQFQTFGAACAGARSFTYIGQSFGYVDLPRALVTARAAGGGTTTNYRESLWKITTAAPSDVTQTYSNNATGPALDLSLAGNAPMVVKQDDGTGTVTANAADRLFYTRDPAAAIAPFTANISLTISVRDDSESEGQIVTSPVATTFSGIAFDAGAGFRYGRLRLANANGSHLVPLQVPIETQYFLGPPSNTFATNAADQCTTLAATHITMGNFQANLGPLASCKTRMNPSITFANGRGNLQLSAPGNGNNGSVDLTVQLGTGGFGNTSCVVTPPPPPLQATTGSNRLYLQGNWTGPTFDQNPTARATFGVFRGADEVIYIRENF
jgi:MSHA biogenesis protein MshQ